MDEKEMWDISWSSLFMVTGVSSFLFSIGIKLLEGSHSPLLLKIGLYASILAVLSWGIKKINQLTLHKKEKATS
jgi:hypothetical protein